MKNTVIPIILLVIVVNAQSQHVLKQNKKAADNSFPFSDGYEASIQKDFVLIAKDSQQLLLFYPVSTIDSVKPDIFSIRRYFWTKHLQKIFANEITDTLSAHPSYDFLFRKGVVTEKKTGRAFYVLTDTARENADKLNAEVAFIVWLHPITAEDGFWKKNDISLSNSYRLYNRFPVLSTDLTGSWKEKKYTEKYNRSPGYMHGCVNTYFQFNTDSSFTKSTNYYVGYNRIGLSAPHITKGTYRIEGKYLIMQDLLTKNSEKYECRFEAVSIVQKKLHLTRGKFEHYNLIRDSEK